MVGLNLLGVHTAYKMFSALKLTSRTVWVNSFFVLYFVDIQSIRGLAVDWLSRNLYWISSEFDETQINVAHLDGSLKTSIIHGIDKPQSLAVYPAKG